MSSRTTGSGTRGASGHREGLSGEKGRVPRGLGAGSLCALTDDEGPWGIDLETRGAVWVVGNRSTWGVTLRPPGIMRSLE